MSTTALRVASRPRAFVAVVGPDAASYLQRMLSNDVEALGPGEACDALLLTAKARVIAPMVVLRRSADDFLLLTEPGLGEVLRAELERFRFAAKCSVEAEPHISTLVIGSAAGPGEIPNGDYGLPAHEILDVPPHAVAAEPVADDELELLRIRARTPRVGRELDDRVMPAEAGLDARAVSFTKGCFPGQEPVARLHYRGHPNRGLRVLAVAGDEPLAYDTELTLGGKVVGRVTSAVADPAGGLVALAFVRREVPENSVLAAGSRRATQLH